MANKGRKLITLSNDVDDDITRRNKHEDFNFSEWVETTYIKEFMSESNLTKKIDFHKKQADILQEKLDYLKQKRADILDYFRKSKDKKVKENIELSKIVIEKHPRKFEPRLRAFNNEYETDLTRSEFMELLEMK